MKHDQHAVNAIRQEIHTEFSFLDSRPSLRCRIMNDIQGGNVVKKKISLGLVLAIILVLITGTVALAAVYRGVTYFLFEKYGEPVSLDEDYLLSGLRQHHNSEHLNATVVDAYWDGVEFSVAYHVSPADPAQTLRVPCDDPRHDHYLPAEEADILLQTPSFINITDENGDITRPYGQSCSWLYEKDGSVSLLVSFSMNDMSQPVSVSIPIFYTLTSSGKLFQPMLHCDSPALADPVPKHEHDWMDASCISPKACAICGRTEGGLGDHDFRLTEKGTPLVCGGCGDEWDWPAGIPLSATVAPGDYTSHVLLVQLRLNELGYYHGRFSARYDEATTEAVKAYQESRQLTADGVCGFATLQALFPAGNSDEGSLQ